MAMAKVWKMAMARVMEVKERRTGGSAREKKRRSSGTRELQDATLAASVTR